MKYAWLNGSPLTPSPDDDNLVMKNEALQYGSIVACLPQEQLGYVKKAYNNFTEVGRSKIPFKRASILVYYTIFKNAMIAMVQLKTPACRQWVQQPRVILVQACGCLL